MVYDLRRIILKYFNSEFSFPDVPTTYSAIESTFGAVYKKPGNEFPYQRARIRHNVLLMF